MRIMVKFRNNNGLKINGKNNVFLLVVGLLLFLTPVKGKSLTLETSQASAYRLEITEKTPLFHIPYEHLTIGNSFRLLSRSNEWSWNGEKLYEGILPEGHGPAGYFENIPVPAGISPGEYKFDLVVGATFDGITCYSDPVLLIVEVRALAGSQSDTICSEERVQYTPPCIADGQAMPEDYRWQRAEAEGIREKASSGTGSIDEVLTNTTYKPIEVRYVYTVTPNECYPDAGFELRVMVNPAINFKVINNRVELCDGERTDIKMEPDIPEISYVWDVEAFGVEGAERNSGKSIEQILQYENAPAMVLYRISAVSTGGGNVCSEEQTTAVRVKPLPEISLTWLHPGDNVTLGTPLTVRANPTYYDSYLFYFNGEKHLQKESELVHYDWKENADNRVTVTVRSDEGCENTDSLVFTGPSLSLPNVITPNGDGINDKLFTGFELQVFNRNGSQLYKGKEGWDGMYQGQPVPAGTYLYVVHYRTPEGREIMKKYHVYVREK